MRFFRCYAGIILKKQDEVLTFEYSLVGGENDSRGGCQGAGRTCTTDINCHVNLIPVNPIKERNFVQSDHESDREFQK